MVNCVSFRPGTALAHVNALLLCLPSLRQSDIAVKKFWLSVRREGKVMMNKLFVEMLEAYFRWTEILRKTLHSWRVTNFVELEPQAKIRTFSRSYNES